MHLNVGLFHSLRTHPGEEGSKGKYYIFNIILIRAKGPATRCDIAHLRWDVLKPLRCIKIACDVLRCILQHVGNFSPDFGISLFIVRFSIGLHHCDGHVMSFHVMHGPAFSVKYF